MDELIKKINQYPNGTILIIIWEDGLKIKGIIDTIYETDNGLDLNDVGYLEFFVALLRIVNIIENPRNVEKLKIGDLIEISMENSPLKILLDNGDIIYK